MIKQKIQFNRGYTLLFAVLVSSLVLAVGISILNISKKEFLLASSARESTTAFYAADSGLECAVYFDGRSTFSGESISSVDCARGTFPVVWSNSGSNNVYTIHLKLNASSCAIIKVTKMNTGTSIESRGYNLGWTVSPSENGLNCSAPSPRRVERALYYTY